MSQTGRRSERVFLTGFMGSGKSTIGPILANTIGFAFVDTDRAIEEQAGKSVSRIFLEEGEHRFRTLEHSLVQGLCAQRNIVAALGGGTLLDQENQRALRNAGITVYLKATPGELFRRLSSKTDRPMLRGPSGETLSQEQLRERIEQLIAAREPVYEQADIVVPTDNKRVGVTVDMIVHRLGTLAHHDRRIS